MVTQFNINSELSDLLELQKKSDQNEFDEQDSSKSNFCSKDISYFDSNLNVEFIKICEDKQIYQNVFFFMNQI